jgi:hypothetical protein
LRGELYAVRESGRARLFTAKAASAARFHLTKLDHEPILPPLFSALRTGSLHLQAF